MKNKGKIYVTKASGETAEFSAEKLRNSLERSGATKEQAEKIIQDISGQLYQGISTRKIYGMAFRLLRGSPRHLAAKYNLKRAIMELGPSGYPFEKFFAEMLKLKGFQTAVGQIEKGKCVNHEVDVIAHEKNAIYVIECKYHNQPGTVCDVKIPLYIHSRFNDITEEWSKQQLHAQKKHHCWVVTNTRFTSDAIQYGNCAGLKLIGWNYPDGESLRSQIDASMLYPITCLTSLTKSEKQALLDKKIVLCKEMMENGSLLLQTGIKASKMDAVMKEIGNLCLKLNKKERAKSRQLLTSHYPSVCG